MRKETEMEVVYDSCYSLFNPLLHTHATRYVGTYLTKRLFQMLHVGSQVDIFCQKLIELSNYSGKDKSQSLIIRDIVIRHQKIICLSKNIEKVFTYISLGQFLLNISVICFISFILAVVSKYDLCVLS